MNRATTRSHLNGLPPNQQQNPLNHCDLPNLCYPHKLEQVTVDREGSLLLFSVKNMFYASKTASIAHKTATLALS